VPERIVVLSGRVASGKSSLAQLLTTRHGFVRFKTQELIITLKGTRLARAALQKAGETLDRETKGAWVSSALTRELQRLPESVQIVVDSVRTQDQVDHLRRAFGPIVTHVHLAAPEPELARRYSARSGTIVELKSYSAVQRDPTESHVETLGGSADILIDSERSSPDDVLVRVATRLGLYRDNSDALVDVLVGGQYGSEGKGNVAGYLAPEYDVLVRVGGPNAGHKVYQEPKPQTFYHLPSGTRRAPRAQIVLGPGAVIWLQTLMEEIAACELEKGRLFIDPQAMIIEAYDREFEERGLRHSIGSTAQGVGSATSRKILRLSAEPKVRLAKDVEELRPFLRETLSVLDDAYRQGHRVFLEGTQGTGLSIHHADYPHVTSRDTTVSGCLSDTGIPPSRVRRVVMLCRTYPIRVESPKGGTSGKMERELTWAEISKRSRIAESHLQEAEKTTTTKRKRRVAEFNWVLLRRAASLNGPTDIALSFTDYISIDNQKARRFEQLTPETINFVEEVESVACAPVSLIVTRFSFRNIIDRRSWGGRR
jgi:adenylosuccinate synthase